MKAITRTKIIALLALAWMTASCGMRPEEDVLPGEYEFTLVASADEYSGTRTSYEGDKVFSWTAGDCISVLFHNGAAERFFTLATTDCGKTATFRGMIDSGFTPGGADGKKWALYPAEDHFRRDGTIYFNQSAAFSGPGSGIPLAALGTDAGAFVFKPMCSVVKFSFTGIEASRVGFTVTNRYKYALSGYFPCKEGGFCLYWPPRDVPDGSAERSIEYSATVEGGCASFYVPVTAWNVSKFTPQIILRDAASGSVIYSATAKQGFPIEANASMGRITVVPAMDCAPAEEKMNTVTYTESTENIINPERGYYVSQSFRSASDSPVSASKMRSARYAGRSLMLLEFYLTPFMESDISGEYLTLVENNFKAMRSGGMKCILRFAYKDNYREDDHPWDATESVVMRHIAQLKPLLQSYSDVIFVLQAGFIGSWGEWYYTDNFVMSPSTDADYLPRKRVLQALLDAMPADRQVQVRTPAFKLRLLGLSASDALTAATAHDGSARSRVGGHNDCFVASSNDKGTFNSAAERSFWKADSKYTIMGGETCAVSDYCHCSPQSGAPGVLSELADYHWTYLNSGYHSDVLKLWRTEGCSDEVSLRLGYRIVLSEASFTGSPARGGVMKAVLKLRNKGFAAPMNPRGAFLVLTDASGGELGRWPLGSDPRTWQPDDGEIVIEKSFTLPSAASGNLSLHLALPDAAPTLAADPEFAIQLANDGVWDEDSGLNLLYSFSI